MTYRKLIGSVVGPAEPPQAETAYAAPPLTSLASVADRIGGRSFLDACRTLRANVTPGEVGGPPPPLMLLGTTSHRDLARVAAGLGLAFAETGYATVVVDADLRAPALHDIFPVEPAPGFAEALAGSPVQPQPSAVSPQLWVLPAGEAGDDPAALLRGAPLTRVAHQLAQQFDCVVYRVSGQAQHPDALLMAAAVRHAVLIVRDGVDSVEAARDLKRSLARAAVHWLGLALLEL